MLVVGLPRREAACSGAARSRAPAKRPQQTISVLPRPSLGPPSKRAKILPPKMIFRHNFVKHKIETFSDQCIVGIVSDSRDPVSCRPSLGPPSTNTETSCFFVQLPKMLQRNCPLLFSRRSPPTICARSRLSPSLQLDPPEFGLSALVRGVRLFRQLA